MNSNKLTKKDYFFIGSMLFGLFFGAGNLIFPVHMGQAAGGNVLMANLGFLVTAIGLPFLGVIAMGLTRSNGLFDMAKRVNKAYAYVFTILLYLVIGPFFALPRLATTSYQIGIAPFVPEQNTKLVLAIFSIVFFVVAWAVSRKPGKILDYVGKFLNPIFLLLLGVLIVLAFLNPMGSVSGSAVQEAYVSNAFLTGFTDGYNTLDALASLAFGIIVINAIRSKGVEEPSEIAKDTVKSGVITLLLMGLIYTCLSYMGAMSLGKFEMSENGGIALAQIAKHYLGTGGSVLLALIVIVACLKTAIGLITAFSETFAELFPSISYNVFAVFASILPCIFANFGLNNIISYSLPVLFFIYPLAITLILLSLSGPLFNHDKRVYQMTTLLTVVASLFDAINASPEWIKKTDFAKNMIEFAKNNLPFYKLGMGWVTPALVGLVIGYVWYILSRKKVN